MNAVGPNKKLRMCPICSAVTEETLCPDDQIATLLVNPPRIDASLVEPGTLIGGRYVVEALIGKGGFGSVYRARHTGTGQTIAIKCLSTIGDQEEVQLKRFFQEARVTAGLRHPNTIRVFDFGQDDSGLIFLAMELLNGVTLKQELRLRRKDGRVFSMAETVEIGIGICRSLSEAHKAGLVHRDLKPDNIFLHRIDDEDVPTVKVLDFGIVKFANSTLTLGSDSGVPGTPAYMSPEQVVKRDVDGRSDLYSVGVVLYQLVSGKVPLRGESIVQTLYMHVHESAPDLKPRVRTPVSSRFCDLVHSALEKSPDHRPPNAQAMREELERILEEGDKDLATRVMARPEPMGRPPSNETMTSPYVAPRAPEARTPSFFSNPAIELNDISVADVDHSRRDVWPSKPPQTGVPWWVYAMLILVVGVLSGIILILVSEPDPVMVERPTIAADPTPALIPIPPPTRTPEPVKEVVETEETEETAEAAPEEPTEPELVAPAPDTRSKRRVRRPKRRTRPEPEPTTEEQEQDEVLDQKI